MIIVDFRSRLVLKLGFSRSNSIILGIKKYYYWAIKYYFRDKFIF